ncbi:MAG: TonB-dependent receptor [Xanthomonadales bacterium]|nr:TonB-dependent receptor [Xanthomonadales bacterium]
MLEHFRAQGYPFAYSSSLVSQDLVVLSEPRSQSVLDIVDEILEPHGLEVRQQDGVLLIIRAARGPPGAATGSLLVFVRGPDSRLFEPPVTFSGSHGFTAVEPLGTGVWQIRDIPAGHLALDISAPGYVPLRRPVVISPDAPSTLHLRLEPMPFELENLTVSTSRYVLFSNSQFYVDQRAIQSLPGNGEDPLRAAHRLPGAAAGGWSAQTHFRGGEENETAIFLNGQRLLDPFHVRDYHNVFSAIDARSISGVEAWTGGFPAAYGDRMSGILLLQSRQPDRPRRHELGISVYNTSLLTTGLDEQGRFDWLISARRSNLGVVLDRTRHGKPDYHDVFATLGYNPSPATRLTFNALHARDRILAITEHRVDEREESRSDTRNTQGWIQLEHDWPGGLGLSAVLSRSAFSNRRDALLHDPEQLVGEVQDDRDVDVTGLRVDFVYPGSGRHLLSWGLELRDTDARYRYQSQAEYNGFYLAYPGVNESLARYIDAAPSGQAWSLYLSDRWQARPSLALDAGLRWDQQTWVEGDDAQFSPRLSVLWSPRADTDLRLTWGRYYQSQQIQQLQVEDGVDRFYPAQRADHLIAGIARRIGSRWAVRAEVFEKRYARLRPRFENLLDPVPLVPELEPDRVRIAPQSARARGAEFTVEFDSETWNGWASYTLARVTDRVDGVNQPRNWDQRHALQAGASWRRGPWELGVALKAHSGWPTTPASLEFGDDGEPILVPGPRNSAQLNTFVNLDLRVTRRWQLPRSQLTGYFELNNALDRRNECCVDYDLEDEDEPVLERSVDHWLGIAPAVGLLWEF